MSIHRIKGNEPILHCFRCGKAIMPGDTSQNGSNLSQDACFLRENDKKVCCHVCEAIIKLEAAGKLFERG